VRLALRGIEHPVIVELGAHVGEDTRWLSEGCGKYLAVEPDTENFKGLCRNVPKVLAVRAAISDICGEILFYPAYNTESINRASGSTHRPTGHISHFPQVHFQQPYFVDCWTLDYLCSSLQSVDLIWCDIQGAERETMKRTRFMMIEAEPEVELYEGQALKPELIAMLPEWYVVEDFGYNLLMANREFNAKSIR
jgi:FkbM family methyltransferase